MRIIDDTFIIGIDSGYGNIKTANCCFPASVAAYDTEPVFKDNMLVYGNRFYLIGEGHKEFLADKTRDNDYYVLALAAIAREKLNALRTAAEVGDPEAVAKYEEHLAIQRERNQKHRQKLQEAREADPEYISRLEEKERVKREKMLETERKWM